ncbi:MAG: membrane dipeptidase [Erysipelotrichaceae bacterium]|nr:membrane dipeptidase [Erysipelotrichaceae bacterium]
MRIVDLHCDTITRLYFDDEDDQLRENECHLDLQKLESGDYLLQNFAIFLDMTEYENLDDLTKKIIAYYYEQLEANKERIKPVFKYDDLDHSKLNALLTVEDSELIPYERLEEFYGLGVRMITLTWNYPNRVGFPNLDGYNLESYEDLRRIDRDNGLSAYGIAYVKKMEELGIIIDVSHCSDKVVGDVLEHTTKPFVASHSNARACCDVGRNLPDDLIVAMAQRGCVIGLNYLGDFLSDDRANESRIADMVRHLKHFEKLGVLDNVGLGSDFDGIDGKLEVYDGRALPNLVRALKKEFTPVEVKKITHLNVLRLYQQLL